MKFLLVIVCLGAVFFFECRNDQRLQTSNAIAASVNAANNSNKNEPPKTAFSNQNRSRTAMTNFRKEGDLEYEIVVKKDDRTVSINYQIKNTGKKSYVLFNRGISPDCETGKAFVETAENGTIEIAQKLFRQPPNIECPALETPIEQGVSVLKPGQTVVEKISVALPLKYDTPFNYCYRGASLPAILSTANKIKFCLGYLETDLSKSEIEGCSLKKWSGSGEQKILCSEIVEF